MKATIRISDLRLKAIVGINEWETKKPQTILVNIKMDYDAGKAVVSDDINDALDYKAVKLSVIRLIKDSRSQLLEKLASRVLEKIMSHPKIIFATVRIDKPLALRFARSVSVEISRHRTSSPLSL